MTIIKMKSLAEIANAHTHEGGTGKEKNETMQVH